MIVQKINPRTVQSLSLRSLQTYIVALIFILGNVVLPQLCHLIPSGGHIFLPIYFFTLIAAYRYGVWAGLLTAVLSPLVNSFLFGMPLADMLPAIMVKSVLLAGIASYVANRQGAVRLLALLSVVLSYQIVGSFVEGLISANGFHAAFIDFKMGIPGMILQVAGGWFLMKKILH